MDSQGMVLPAEEGGVVDSESPIKLTKLRDLIRDIPDFPKMGVVFKDITPLLRDQSGLSLAIEYMTQPFRARNVRIVAGAESRGFIFGTAVAQSLSAGFVPIRKPGKLPFQTLREAFDLEYGQDSLEIHSDAIQPGDRVLLVDDVLATGGTMQACSNLVKSLGGEVVGAAFLIELNFLKGRDRLGDLLVHSVLHYGD